MEEFVKEYSEELRRLTRNDKASINALSMLADANAPHAAGIVSVIEQHILTCPPPAKLPALYLMDSIIKNAGEPFTSKFAARLPEVFGAVWDSTLADKRSSLSRLYGTWAGVLPEAVLSRVAARMVSTSGTSGRAAGVAAGGGSMAGRSHMQQQQLPSLVLEALPQQQPGPQQLGHYAPTLGGGMQYMQQQQLAPQPYGLHGGVQLLGGGAPVLLPAGQQPPAFVQVNGQLVPVLQGPPPPQLLHQAVQLQPGQPASARVTPQHASSTPQHVMQAVGMPSPAHPGMGSWQPQHPSASPGAALRASPHHSSGRTPARSSSPGAAAAAAASAGGGGGGPASAELTTNALSDLLSSLAQSGVLAQKQAAQATKAEAAAVKATQFTPAFLKVLHPAVLDVLEAESLKQRPRFRDAEFQRNKRRAAAAGANVSRSWYLSVDTWIAGTRALTDEAAAANPFADEEAGPGSEQAEAPPVEPEDPEQPMCAISGEPFDKFFDQDAEGWFFQGAKRIRGEEAARYGVPDGSLVKVKCLAEAGIGSGTAGLHAAGGGGGEDAAADLAAAAAAAPAAGAQAGEQPAPEGEPLPQQAPGHGPAAVKQEDPVAARLESKAEPVGAAAAAAAAAGSAQCSGPKREAGSSPEGEGTPAKKARVDQG